MYDSSLRMVLRYAGFRMPDAGGRIQPDPAIRFSSRFFSFRNLMSSFFPSASHFWLLTSDYWLLLQPFAVRRPPQLAGVNANGKLYLLWNRPFQDLLNALITSHCPQLQQVEQQFLSDPTEQRPLPTHFAYCETSPRFSMFCIRIAIPSSHYSLY